MNTTHFNEIQLQMIEDYLDQGTHLIVPAIILLQANAARVQ